MQLKHVITQWDGTSRKDILREGKNRWRRLTAKAATNGNQPNGARNVPESTVTAASWHELDIQHRHVRLCVPFQFHNVGKLLFSFTNEDVNNGAD